MQQHEMSHGYRGGFPVKVTDPPLEAAVAAARSRNTALHGAHLDQFECSILIALKINWKFMSISI